MKIKSIIVLLFFYNFCSCQRKDDEKNINLSTMKNINMSNIEKFLEKQIALGNDEDYGSFDSYNDEDLLALVEYENFFFNKE